VEISARTSRSVERQGSLRSVASEGYSRHRPELTALYAIVRDNLETFFGSVAGLQRSSADLRLNPHVHAVFLDGAWYEVEPDVVHGRPRSAPEGRAQGWSPSSTGQKSPPQASVANISASSSQVPSTRRHFAE
jgi:hypothetical protein